MGEPTRSPSGGALDANLEAELWRRHAAGDAHARAELLERHVPYARVVAASFYKRRTTDDVEFGDYLQWAAVALIESVDRFRPDQGAGFRTFAAHRMRGAILDGLRQSTEHRQQVAAKRQLEKDRLESVTASGSSMASEDLPGRSGKELFAFLADVGVGLALGILLEGTGMIDGDAFGQASEPDPPYQHAELKQLKLQVLALARKLPESQRQVLELHYLGEVCFSDIAGRLGLTKGRISQIHQQALGTLREALLARIQVDLVC